MFQVVARALSLLDRRSKRILGLLMLVQIALSFLDLIGILLVGLVAALASSNLTGQSLPLVNDVLERLGWTPNAGDRYVLVLAALAGVAFVLKSVTSFALVRRSYRFLANRQAVASSRLAARVLARPFLDLQERPSQDIAYALTAGVSSAMLGVLGGAVIIVSESAVLAVIAIGLLAVDPVVAVATVAFFGIVALVVQRVLGGRARSLGHRFTIAEVSSMASVQNALHTYREMTISGRRDLFVNGFEDLRWQSAEVQADMQIVSQVTKYVFEIALVLGAAILAVSQAATRETSAAIAVVAVFLAAASRTMPSLLRLQQAAVGIRTSSGVASSALALNDESPPLSAERSDPDLFVKKVIEGVRTGHDGFEPSIAIRDVSVTYPGADGPAVDGVSLTVAPGQSLALVGTTGAGKSTLADVILGILPPDSGDVEVSGLSPHEAALRWAGAIAYVPQDITIIDGTIRQNVALGLPDGALPDDWVWAALERAHLAGLLRGERDGLDTFVGEKGVRLSGGQRQRLGLARALLTRPRLVLMDEATSALDAETEQLVTNALAELEGDVTLVLVAHRLATIRACDQIAYIEAGRVTALGTFEEVRSQEPRFERQARLLGL